MHGRPAARGHNRPGFADSRAVMAGGTFVLAGPARVLVRARAVRTAAHELTTAQQSP